MRTTQIAFPTLVRVKDGALERVGIYLRRHQIKDVVVMQSEGLPPSLPGRLADSLHEQLITPVCWSEIVDNSFEDAVKFYGELPKRATAVVGLGGGKAIDVAKYVATLARLPFFAVPTSLSNDGFSSPQSSLTMQGKRRSLPAAIPFGVVIDTAVSRQAPKSLTLSGVGDLVAKFTAVRDWKLAFHANGTPVNDFAALLSDGSVHAFLSHPEFDAEGMRLLATALLMNGIAMEMSGSSRPASGSEHLISHALDQISRRPRLHGLQVGVASYLASLLQNAHAEQIASLFEVTGFWDQIAEDPFSRDEWLEAVRVAPTLKEGYYTVLSSRDVMKDVEQYLMTDPYLQRCFN
jgi:glycerol-1-phosphate dehydrogenase [NAD(P)+]